MKQCIPDVVAFGLNALEFTTLVTVACIALVAVLTCYLNQGIGETKEERWARNNPFLAADVEAEKMRNRNVR